MTKLEDLVLLSTLLWASYTDWRERRIYNLTTGGAAALGLTLGVLRGPENAMSALQGLAVGLLIFWPFYVLGGMGGGDVKLLAAVGSLKGPHFVVETGIWASLIGGVWALLLFLWRFAEGRKPSFPERSKLRKTPSPELPYGIAIALGALLGFCGKGVLL